MFTWVVIRGERLLKIARQTPVYAYESNEGCASDCARTKNVYPGLEIWYRTFTQKLLVNLLQ